MAAILVLPGIGGQYVSETFTAITSASAGLDTLDLSRCGMFSIQLGSGQGQGSVQMQQSFNGVNWANYGTALTVTSNGAVSLFDLTDGPFGMQRITTSLTLGTCRVTVTGYPIPMSW